MLPITLKEHLIVLVLVASTDKAFQETLLLPYLFSGVRAASISSYDLAKVQEVNCWDQFFCDMFRGLGEMQKKLTYKHLGKIQFPQGLHMIITYVLILFQNSLQSYICMLLTVFRGFFFGMVNYHLTCLQLLCLLRRKFWKPYLMNSLMNICRMRLRNISSKLDWLPLIMMSLLGVPQALTVYLAFRLFSQQFHICKQLGPINDPVILKEFSGSQPEQRPSRRW